MKAIFLPKKGNASANLLWVPPLDDVQRGLLLKSLAKLRIKGYFASAFPEGDGVTIDSEEYDEAVALHDVCNAFDWIIIEPKRSQNADALLNQIHKGHSVQVRYLVPAETLDLSVKINLSSYTIHPPVVPGEYMLDSDSALMHLADIPGIDVDPSWDPRSAPSGSLARLLAYPIIEGTMKVDSDLLFPVGAGTAQHEPLIFQITSHADRVLDVLRFRYCNYYRPQFTPQTAGVMNDGFRAAYVIPDDSHIKCQLIVSKPEVFESVNRWLGLEIGHLPDLEDDRLARIASGDCHSEIELMIRSALRTRGQSFMQVSQEFRFISLVFGIDTVSAVGKRTGDEHRRHVAALASYASPDKFQDTLKHFKALYKLRNDIVHKGQGFGEIGSDSKNSLIGIDKIMMSCIHVLLQSSWLGETDLITAIKARLSQL